MIAETAYGTAGAHRMAMTATEARVWPWRRLLDPSIASCRPRKPYRPLIRRQTCRHGLVYDLVQFLALVKPVAQGINRFEKLDENFTRMNGQRALLHNAMRAGTRDRHNRHTGFD